MTTATTKTVNRKSPVRLTFNLRTECINNVLDNWSTYDSVDAPMTMNEIARLVTHATGIRITDNIATSLMMDVGTKLATEGKPYMTVRQRRAIANKVANSAKVAMPKNKTATFNKAPLDRILDNLWTKLDNVETTVNAIHEQLNRMEAASYSGIRLNPAHYVKVPLTHKG